MAVPVSRELAAVRAAIPRKCYDNPTVVGLLYFLRDAAIYVAAAFGLLHTDAWYLVLPLWVVAALAVGGLFVIGHDAAHGALFRSRRLCYLVGQTAFLPSLHAYSVWALGHNRVHHGHTGCEGVDFVWHPLTKDQYESLPRWAQLRHRIEWTPWGAGLYYLRVVWWDKMMHAVPPKRLRQGFARDRCVVVAFATLSAAALLAWGYGETGSLTGAVWTYAKVFLVPWVLFNQTIGTVVYLHHIAPDVPWYSRAAWSQRRGQVDATVSYAIPAWLNFFWHNIFVHVPHHVDVRIPFYHLPRALDALSAAGAAPPELRGLRLSCYVTHARRCKLYDFERGVWTDYSGRVAVAG